MSSFGTALLGQRRNGFSPALSFVRPPTKAAPVTLFMRIATMVKRIPNRPRIVSGEGAYWCRAYIFNKRSFAPVCQWHLFVPVMNKRRSIIWMIWFKVRRQRWLKILWSESSLPLTWFIFSSIYSLPRKVQGFCRLMGGAEVKVRKIVQTAFSSRSEAQHGNLRMPYDINPPVVCLAYSFRASMRHAARFGVAGARRGRSEHVYFSHTTTRRPAEYGAWLDNSVRRRVVQVEMVEA